MAEPTIPTFKFYRTGEVIKVNGVIGNRGILIADGTVYHTIERDIAHHVNVPIGTFKLKMEFSPSNSARRQFRIRDHNVVGFKGPSALLIHVANYPDQITGCIAPGIMTIANGVGESALAMEALFKACGGFSVKEEAAILEVINKPSDSAATVPAP